MNDRAQLCTRSAIPMGSSCGRAKIQPPTSRAPFHPPGAMPPEGRAVVTDTSGRSRSSSPGLPRILPVAPARYWSAPRWPRSRVVQIARPAAVGLTAKMKLRLHTAPGVESWLEKHVSRARRDLFPAGGWRLAAGSWRPLAEVECTRSLAVRARLQSLARAASPSPRTAPCGQPQFTAAYR